jgi:hypothetical protein
MTYPGMDEIESHSDKTGHKEMELAVEGRREDSVAVDYYLFLLLSKTLRSVVTIEMFYLTRRFRGVKSVEGRAMSTCLICCLNTLP